MSGVRGTVSIGVGVTVVVGIGVIVVAGVDVALIGGEGADVDVGMIVVAGVDVTLIGGVGVTVAIDVGGVLSKRLLIMVTIKPITATIKDAATHKLLPPSLFLFISLSTASDPFPK
jgi:hypothetical protein